MGSGRIVLEAEIRRRSIAVTSFVPPCSEGQIVDAERPLGHALPPALRRLYDTFDGFLGPTNAALYGRCPETTAWSGSISSGAGRDRPSRCHRMAPRRRRGGFNRRPFDSRCLGEGAEEIR